MTIQPVAKAKQQRRAVASDRKGGTMIRYSRENVQTHYGSGRPAVNVKVYGDLDQAWRDWEGYAVAAVECDRRFSPEWVEQNVSEEQLDRLFWDVCATEWEMIERDAEEIFGRDVRLEQDGRSGGWAVVTSLPDVEDWDAVQLAKWRRFEKFAKGTADGVPYQMLSTLYLNEFATWADEESERLGGEAFNPAALV